MDGELKEFGEMLSKMPPDEFLTPAVVARKLKLSDRCLRYLMQTRRLPAVKLGRQWRIPAKVLLEYVKKCWRELHNDENGPATS